MVPAQFLLIPRQQGLPRGTQRAVLALRAICRRQAVADVGAGRGERSAGGHRRDVRKPKSAHAQPGGVVGDGARTIEVRAVARDDGRAAPERGERIDIRHGSIPVLLGSAIGRGGQREARARASQGLVGRAEGVRNVRPSRRG
jgi:hypothetical protein